jgi:hypothetical protein
MATRRTRATLASILVAACLSSPLSAFAQSDEQRAAARELATAGVDSFKAGKYEQALDSFGKAESLYHALPHLLFIARSHAKLNQYVRAREAYMKVIKEVLPANAPQAARDAQTSASSEVSNIEPKIGRVTITVANKEQAKDLVVTVDGVAISSVLIGAPVPIDPGEHAIEAVATGLRGKAAVHVEPGQRQEVPLTLEQDASAVPPLAAGAVVAAQPQQAAPPPTAAQPQAVPPPTQPDADQGKSGGTNGLRIGSYVAFGVGAVGLVGGTVFMIQSGSKTSEVGDICNLPNDACPLDRKDDVNGLEADAKSARTLGIVGFVVGGVGVGAGVTLFILSSKKKESTASLKPTVSPWVGLGSAGLRGTF